MPIIDRIMDRSAGPPLEYKRPLLTVVIITRRSVADAHETS